ncbi:thioesterase family protein [Paludicola sp. MB14-C6]|uniref:thioesterase family protein n=1 Tax=Paludihabitans sp. MB14-C6 TaxID=3070656 RepID=UPI0027DB6288|nr:thioesterase family protein [Paludicola sp. MB14-C6]WMJ23431.1 thioesterase family protein [Paludicola sp. MB14-C6]
MKEIKIGEVFEKEIEVNDCHLACNVGSGDVAVYATPMMIALMEEVSAKCLQQFIDKDMTSVGTCISSSHVAATPKGMKVKAVAKIVAVEGRKVNFEIRAYDETGLIGEGTHERFILNRDKFHEKAQAKLRR